MKDEIVVDINKEEYVKKAQDYIEKYPPCYRAWMSELFDNGQDLVYPQKYISWLDCFGKFTPSMNLAQIPMKALNDGKSLKVAIKLFKENGANEFVIEDTLRLLKEYYKNGNEFLEAYNNMKSTQENEYKRVLK